MGPVINSRCLEAQARHGGADGELLGFSNRRCLGACSLLRVILAPLWKAPERNLKVSEKTQSNYRWGN